MKIKQTTVRFMVIVKEGAPHGDLYELEHYVYYNIVDRRTQHVIITFQGEMEATYSRTRGGMWDNYHCSAGVCDVTIAPDEQSVLVRYADGHEEVVPLPNTKQKEQYTLLFSY